MRINQVPLATAIILGAAIFAGGCKSSPPAPSAPANTDQTAQQPAPSQPGTPPAATPAPAPEPAATPAPAPEPSAAATPAPIAPAAPPEPKVVSLTAPTGATVSVAITQQLSASKNNVGDPFSGELSAPVTTSGGATVFPKGSRVEGTVVAAKGQGKFKGSGALGIQVTSINGKPVNVASYEKEQKGKGKRSATMIGGGGGAGALIGGLAGGGKGALIGGLVGAGAGTAGAAFTGNKDVVIPAESIVTFHLTAPVTVERTQKPKA
jgi:hypothetical protein